MRPIVVEHFSASFRSDGTVSVALNNKSRRFLTTYTGFREALDAVSPELMMLDTPIVEGRFNGIDLMDSKGIVIAGRNGKLRMGQFFQASDVDMHIMLELSDEHAEEWVTGVQALGILLRHDIVPVPEKGAVILNAFIRARVPARFWAATFNANGTFDKETRSQVFVMDGKPRYARTIGNHTKRWAAGNVHGDGHICWGETRVDDVTSLDELDNRFLTSPFNGDLMPVWRWAHLVSFVNQRRQATERGEELTGTLAMLPWVERDRLHFTHAGGIGFNF